MPSHTFGKVSGSTRCSTIPKMTTATNQTMAIRNAA